MRRRFITTISLLAISLIIMLISTAACAEGALSGTCGDYAFWELDAEGRLTIQGDGAMDDLSDVQAPWGNSITSVLIEEGITYIGAYSFSNCSKLTNVYIPSSVKEIGIDSFLNCSSLEKLTIPEGVEEIWSEAFSGCSSLTEIKLPNSLKYLSDAFSGCLSLTSVKLPDLPYIEAHTFSNCRRLEKIAIPESVASIGKYAFSSCVSLKEIVIPDSVTRIGYDAFHGCRSLKRVILPNGLKEIEYNTFMLCDSLTDIVIPGSVEYIGWDAFCGCTGLTSLIIPEGVKGIEGGAFSGCCSLTDVVLPESLAGIPDGAFAECSKLATITIPQNVEWIGEGAFTGCRSLTEFKVDERNPYLSSISGVLFNKDLTELIQVPCAFKGEYRIPESVTILGKFAFYGCGELTKVEIPESVKKIGYYSFDSCRSLSAINVSDGNTEFKSIGGVLYKKDTLELLKAPGGLTGQYGIPDGVKRVYYNAFLGCGNLTGVTIPQSLTEIEEQAFNDCVSLERFVVAEDNPAYSSLNGVLFNKEKTELIQAPGMLTGQYIIPESVATIAHGAFKGCSMLTEVLIPEGVAQIDYRVFSECYSLKQINVEENNSEYVSIDGALFTKDMTCLIQVPGAIDSHYTVPQGVEYIGMEAFAGCKRLKAVTIPDSVIGFDGGVFNSCEALEAIFFLGTERQWTEIENYGWGSGGDIIFPAMIYYM